jgi:phosphoglycolate phosphatase-like HAD superfamily hydrolase
MKLVLWDIDGTLLYSGGVAGAAMRTALTRVYGRPSHDDRRSYAGKTDQQIILETFPDRDATELLARLPEFAAQYLALLEAQAQELAARGGALPGAAAALRHLGALPVVQTVLTGNLQPVAALKLRLVGLTEHLQLAIGAFGSDHHQRNALPAIALQRATASLGCPFAASDAVVIGDTPNDVACGRFAGARTVAVATGPFGREELAAHAPDAILDDLTDPAALAAAVFGTAS